MPLEHYSGFNLFTETLVALRDGNIERLLAKGTRPMILPFLEILETLELLKDAGFSRSSRRGLATVNHPTIGIITWRHSSYILPQETKALIAINGTEILCTHVIPNQGVRACWIAAAASQYSPEQRECVEGALGFIATIREGYSTE